MAGIISSVVLLAIFIPIIIEERSYTNNCRTLYRERFDNKPIPKDERLSMIAEALTLHTNVRHIATHGCVICQSREQLFTLPEAVTHLQYVRATAF